MNQRCKHFFRSAKSIWGVALIATSISGLPAMASDAWNCTVKVAEKSSPNISRLDLPGSVKPCADANLEAALSTEIKMHEGEDFTAYLGCSSAPYSVNVRLVQNSNPEDVGINIKSDGMSLLLRYMENAGAVINTIECAYGPSKLELENQAK